jgi:hypothetical protein
MKFAQKQDNYAAYVGRGSCICFGNNEGFIVDQVNEVLYSGWVYETPGQGVTLFNGDGGGVFRAARWELWEVE